MGFLDKLKPLPRWKHQDPSVRLEAVRELEDPTELAGLAEHDPDARVRRAAVVKIDEVGALGRVAAGDADEETRDRAADRLFALATAAGGEVTRALAAAEALTDARRLSTLAKSNAAEAVCAAALARTTDDRALSSIARHATREAIARVALGRLTSSDDLVDVAQHSSHRDVAIGAFDRIVASQAAPDLALLRAIESKSEQKAVGKRARALIQDVEDAEAARRLAEEEHRRQQIALCEAVEQLSTLAADVTLLRTELARLSESWQTLNANDAAALERFAQGVSDAQATIARRERETEDAAERARLRAEAIATRDALCTRVETLDGDDALEQLVPIEEEWRSLLPLIGNGPEADRLAGRFAQAVAACRKRHEMRAVLAGTGEQLAGLVAEAEGLLSRDDRAAAAARWPALSRDARGLASLLADGGRPAVDLQARLDLVDQGFAARDAARRDAAAKTQRDLVARLQRLAERARRAAEADAITLKEGDRLMRDLGAGLEDAGRAEHSREIGEAAGLLRKLQEQVAPRVRELRDMDEWRRFANAQRQEQLIAMAEAIVASLKSDTEAGRESDLAATARAMRELHTKWQEAADAPRQTAQRLWDRFRFATDFIRDRCEKYFAAMRAEKGANLQKKTALVEEAEAMAQSSDWGKATARLQAMQTEWQAVGPIPREPAQALAHRFRAACNAFFSRRREDLAERKKAWAENLARKEALCVRAETLVESTEWDAAAAEMKRLQIEWKTVGPVRRNKSETIWNRFRAAADGFFERFHNRHQITMATKLAEREALVVDLEGLAAAEGDAAEGLLERVQTLRTTWNRGVPIPAAEMKPLVDRWQAAFARVLERFPAAFLNTEFDPALVMQRMDKLIARVEALLANVREPVKGQSQAEILAARLRSALATNAMGGGPSEESRWRAAADVVRDAQSAWQRLTPLNGSDTNGHEARFREACRRVNDHVRRHAGQSNQAGPARRPVGPKAAAM
jgi:hypothetical protein